VLVIKKSLQQILENETNAEVFTEIQENLDKIIYDNMKENPLITESLSINGTGNIETDSIKQMFVGNWICYSDFSTFHNNGKFERGLLETSYYASGYWEVNDDKFIITINYRGEDFGEWDLYHKEIYKFSFIDDTLVLTIVEGNDIMIQRGITERIFIRLDKNRNIFGDYSINADYIWESYQNYINRFGWD
jgi:uncharacterized protein YuzE